MDPTTINYSQELNSTLNIGVKARGFNSNNITADVITLLICFIGIIGNSLAAYVLSQSRKIRKIKPYHLLMNQCFIDLVCSVVVIIDIFVEYYLVTENMRGPWDYTKCQILKTGLIRTSLTCSSTYNLCAMSVERTMSVVCPIYHRNYVTSKRIKRTAVLIWPVFLLVTAGLSIPVNGITPSGHCHYWSRLNATQGKIHMVFFNLIISVLPGIAMIVSYGLLYNRLLGSASDSTTGQVNMSVIHTLTTCVVLYFVCHTPPTCLSVASRFAGIKVITSVWFKVAISLALFNQVVNPFVYVVQYPDYRRSLRKLFKKCLDMRSSEIDPNYSSESNTSSRKTDSIDRLKK